MLWSRLPNFLFAFLRNSNKCFKLRPWAMLLLLKQVRISYSVNRNSPLLPAPHSLASRVLCACWAGALMSYCWCTCLGRDPEGCLRPCLGRTTDVIILWTDFSAGSQILTHEIKKGLLDWVKEQLLMNNVLHSQVCLLQAEREMKRNTQIRLWIVSPAGNN